MPRPLGMCSKEFLAYIRSNAESKTVYEMHLETGVNINTIKKYGWRHGLSLMCKSPEKDENERIRGFIKENHHLLTASEAAGQMNITRQRVYGLAYSIGVRMKSEKATEAARGPAIKETMFNYCEWSNWLI